ncbi:MAG: hypothetical protein KAU14_03880, partial [Thermoplasmata archaeon]|nr:hypothetical protein [Thermoplasmata archaeon]
MSLNKRLKTIPRPKKQCWSIYLRPVVCVTAMLLLSIFAGSLPHFQFPTLPCVSAQGNDDSDGDGMPDDWENTHALDPHYPSDAWYDLDRDGYRNLAEYIHGTDPRNSTNFPDIADENDTDGDGVCNFGEYLAGTNWTNASSVPGTNDTDEDGLNDSFELGFGDENSTNYTAGADMNPCDSDTDHDGYQADERDDDGNPADGIKDANHTVGVDEPWMDYDDDHFIEGFNDGVEVKL